ncbi:MAG: STAS domain-containing protein [Gemmatimonadetes bacterium]|nr:MAG: STAS domain-containing protein [Gemmatimonadota bacterium]
MTLDDIKKAAQVVVEDSDQRESVEASILPIATDQLDELYKYINSGIRREPKCRKILIEWGIRSAQEQDDTTQQLKFIRLAGIWSGEHEPKSDQAFTLLEEGLGLAEKYGDTVAMLDFYLALAQISYDRYKFDQAEQWLKAGYSIAKDGEFPKKEVQFIHKFGNLYRALKDNNQAMDWYNAAETFALKNQLHMDYVNALVAKGHIYSHLGQHDSSEELFRKVVAYLKDVPEAVKETPEWWKALANAYYSLSSAVHSQEKYHEALLMLRNAEETIKGRGDEARRYKALITHMFSSVYSTLKNYDKAMYYDQRAYDLSMEINFKELAIVSQVRIAGHHYNQKRYDEAKKLLLQYLPELEKIHQPHILVENWNMLGNIELELGNVEHAEKCFRKALDFAGEIVATPSAYVGLGKVYHKQKKYQRAVTELKRALDLYQERDHWGGAIEVHHLLGTIIDEMDGDYEEILYHFDAAAQLMKKLWNKYAEELEQIDLTIEDTDQRNEYYRYFTQRYQELSTENLEQMERVMKTLHRAQGIIEKSQKELQAGQAELEEARRKVEQQQQELTAARKRQMEQQEIIMELSTPVIQLYEGILTVPVIGTVDSRRADQLMENILNAITQLEAHTAIIDITGVPIVDTEVANHLTKTVQATRLLGADCILVGISPQIAQTLVHIGVDLQHITTRSNLQAGLEVALKKIGIDLKQKRKSQSTGNTKS